MWFNGKPLASPEKEGEAHSFIEDRGSSEGLLQTKAHWRKPAVGSAVTSHWLSCNCLLAEWLQGVEAPPSSCWSGAVENMFLLEMEVSLFQFGGIDDEWQGVGAPPTGPPTPV